MFGRISEEMEVQVSAREAWELYGTLRLARLAEKEVSDIIHKIDVLEGDGDTGTILKLTFPPGTPGFSHYKEKFTKIDNEKRVKVTELIEGAFLELGFTLYRVIFEIIEKTENSCLIKTTVEYEVKEEFAANASLVSIQPLLRIMEAAANCLMKN